MTDAIIEAYWQDFLKTQPPDSPYHGRSYIADHFGDNPAPADELAALVLSGVKTGTCSALREWEAEGNPIPEAGLISIILSGDGSPICILETTEVTLCRFDEVDEDFARSEGEGDLSLAYWRDAHKRYFSRTLPKIGKQFTDDMPLVCERFQVIHK